MSIKLATTDKALSSFGGLKIVNELLSGFRLRDLSFSFLPELKTGKSRSFDKLRNLVFGFAVGADCLDDMALLSHDPGFTTFCDEKSYHPKSYGDFLRSFSERDLQNFESANMELALKLRKCLGLSKGNVMTLDCDSTINRQYGKKMEGVKPGYTKVDCLDTLNIYDDQGIQYYLNVRPGGTYTAKDADWAIQKVIRKIKSDKLCGEKKIWVRADSGYYSSKFINACVAVGADVVLRVKKFNGIERMISQIHDWQAEDIENPNRIKFYDGRECEIGSTHYRMKKGCRRLRYVLMRAKKKDKAEKIGLGLKSDEYDYFAFCTTLDEMRLPRRDVIFFYRKRGQAENYIKEAKNGFDLKHYPCLKLSANQAYGLIAQLAYNLMRFLGLAENPKKTKYVKQIRNRWIFIPCMVAQTCRDRVLRMSKHHFREISEWLKRIHKMQVGLC